MFGSVLMCYHHGLKELILEEPDRFVLTIILMIILECIILIGVLMKQADELQQLAEVEDDNEIL